MRFLLFAIVDSARTLKEWDLRRLWNWFGIGVLHVCTMRSATLSMSVYGEGTRSIAATVKRLKNLKLGRMTDEARVLHERFPEANQVHSISFQNWPLLDTNEAELLQKSSLVLAEQEILEVSSAPDFRLEHCSSTGRF